MYCSFKKYELPDKKILDRSRDLVINNKVINVGIKDVMLRKLSIEILDYLTTVNSLAQKLKFNSKSEFEYKCSNLFNMTKYAINQSVKTKKNTHIYSNSFTVIPLNQIEKCSQYNDFIKSLEKLDTKFNFIKNSEKTSDIIFYNIKTNDLIVFDEYKL